MEEITLHVQLKAKYIDIGGYITYVFENLDFKNYEDQYVMCVQFPNWNQSEIKINDIGYVNVRYVKDLNIQRLSQDLLCVPHSNPEYGTLIFQQEDLIYYPLQLHVRSLLILHNGAQEDNPSTIICASVYFS